MTKTAFHPAHKAGNGAHSFAINDDGTEVQLQFHGAAPLVLSGADAAALRDWLDSAELRSQQEADALKAPPAST